MQRAQRKASGQSLIVMALGIAFLVLLACGLFSFEINRAEVARQQLRTATEAAALAGAATLASSDNTDPTASHNTAINTALTTFQQNSIIGISLGNALITYMTPDNPAVNNSSLYMEFLNPNNNNQPVDIGDANGKILRVTSAFGLDPALGKYLGMGKTIIRSVASGGVPQLDVVLCFDVSASMDDQTPVTFVKRTWNSVQGKNNYTITSTYTGSPAGALAEGILFNIVGPPPTGTACDGVQPQTLGSASNGMDYPIDFSASLRNSPNAGSAPGNYPGVGASTGTARTFTDLVVNIDGNNHFNGLVSNGYNFANLAVLVEASRGNLENTTVFNSSRANVSVPAGIVPIAGYKAEYDRLAKLNSHPIIDAIQASQVFLNIMNTDTDAHFSVVAFTSNAGNSATDSMNMSRIDSSYSAGGTANYPVPMIALNPATGVSNYTTCYNVLDTTGPVSGTNIGDALDTAVTELNTHSRTGCKKAIVLFTDGQPTSGGPLNSDPWTNARMAAVRAKNGSIPIYAIGLAQTPAIIPGETAILTHTNSNTSTGGVCGIAGNGGQFFLVTRVADLRRTFENIARQLVQLVK